MLEEVRGAIVKSMGVVGGNYRKCKLVGLYINFCYAALGSSLRREAMTIDWLTVSALKDMLSVRHM